MHSTDRLTDSNLLLTRAVRVLALTAALPLAVSCALQAERDDRPPRTADVTIRLISQSCLQGEVVPCG